MATSRNKGNASGGATGKVKMPKKSTGTKAGKAISTGAKGKSRSSAKGNTGKTPKGSGAASRMY